MGQHPGPAALSGVDVFTVGRWGCFFSILSVCSSGTMIFLFWKHKALLNTLWNRIVVQLGCMYMLGGVVAMVTEVPLTFGSMSTLTQDSVCKAQAFFIQWLSPLDLLFNTFLMVSLYLAVVWHWNVQRAEPYALAVIWLLPAAVSAALLASGGTYGPAGAWCWVAWPHFRLRIEVLYLWVWTGFAIMIVLEFLVLRHLRAHVHADVIVSSHAPVRRRRVSTEFYVKLSFYPLLYIIVWAPASINRVLEQINMALVDNSTAFAAQVAAIQAGGVLFLAVFVRNNRHTLCRWRRRGRRPPRSSASRSSHRSTSSRLADERAALLSSPSAFEPDASDAPGAQLRTKAALTHYSSSAVV